MTKHRRRAGTPASSASLAACAGLASGHALAQSSVTLYGIVDAGIEYVNHAPPDGGGAFRLKSGHKNT
ncbi:porin, partial [Burkholderia pseudomallei]